MAHDAEVGLQLQAAVAVDRHRPHAVQVHLDRRRVGSRRDQEVVLDLVVW